METTINLAYMGNSGRVQVKNYASKSTRIRTKGITYKNGIRAKSELTWLR